MRVKRVRVVLVLGALILSALWLPTAVSASDIDDVHGEIHNGRISLDTFLGTIPYNRPGSGVGECETSGFEIRANFDAKTRSMDITGFDVKLPFTSPPIFGGGTLQAEATSVERSGRATWNHDGDHTWGPITERLEFEIQAFEEEQGEERCVKLEDVCRGTIEMSFSGVTRNPRDEFPDIYVNGVTAEAIEVEDCSGVWSFILPGAAVEIGVNPDDPTHGSDPGAWFRALAP